MAELNEFFAKFGAWLGSGRPDFFFGAVLGLLLLPITRRMNKANDLHDIRLALYDDIAVVRERSPIHYGAVWLKIIDDEEKKVLGHYWTDRDSAGEMDLTNRQKKTFQTFQSARAHYGRLPATA